MKESFITFEYKGEKFAIQAIELSGAERAIPFVEYPGLPSGIKGIALWNGKVLPIRTIDEGPTHSPATLSEKGTFLICKTDPEFILYVASTVKVLPIDPSLIHENKVEINGENFDILNPKNLIPKTIRGAHAA